MMLRGLGGSSFIHLFIPSFPPLPPSFFFFLWYSLKSSEIALTLLAKSSAFHILSYTGLFDPSLKSSALHFQKPKEPEPPDKVFWTKKSACFYFFFFFWISSHYSRGFYSREKEEPVKTWWYWLCSRNSKQMELAKIILSKVTETSKDKCQMDASSVVSSSKSLDITIFLTSY